MAAERAYKRNPLMADFLEGTFETSDGVTLRYLRKGTGMPLIMLSEWAASVDEFSLNAPELAESHAVFLLDMRGHGFSEASAHGAHLARLAADLAEFIAWIGAPKVNLLGWSMGVSVIWNYLEVFGQEQVERAVFVDQSPFLLANPADSNDEVRLHAGKRIDIWDLYNRLRADFTANLHPTLSEYFGYGQQVFSQEELKRAPDNYYELWQQVPLEPPKARDFLSRLLLDYITVDWRSLLHVLRMPVLLITGDLSFTTTLEAAWWMQQEIPQCTWLRFSAQELGDHQLMQRSYRRFNENVGAFLAGQEVPDAVDSDAIASGAYQDMSASLDEDMRMSPDMDTNAAMDVDVRTDRDAGMNGDGNLDIDEGATQALERDPAPSDVAYVPGEGYEGPVVDIKRVEIGPKKFVAHVKMAAAGPVYTNDDPEATNRILALFPELSEHLCTGDVSPRFGEVIRSTEIAHLLEHVTIELLVRSGLVGDMTGGRTKAEENDGRSFVIEFACPDDVLVAGCLSSAVWVLDWAYAGGGEPTPDVGGIVNGLITLVTSLGDAVSEDVGD